MKVRIRQFWQQQEGVVAPLFAILLVFGIIVGILALVLDLGHMHNVKSELQKAADACALRGARAFLPDIIPTTAVDPDPDRARTQAIDTITRNLTDFYQLTDLPGTDVMAGVWNFTGDWQYKDSEGRPTWQWNPSDLYGKPVGPGILVIVRREGDLNRGPVPTTLASGPPMNIDPMIVRAGAIAALSGTGQVAEGVVDLPITVFKEWFESLKPGSTKTIELYPTSTDNAAWFTPPPDKTTTPGILADYISGDKKFPSMDTNPANDNLDPNNPLYTNIYTNNGVQATLFKETFKEPKNHVGMLFWKWYYETGRAANNGNPTKEWIVHLPIIEKPSNSSDPKPILGFSTWRVEEVQEMPDKKIVMTLIEGIIPDGGGGGLFFGSLSPEPKLVR